MDSLVEEVIKEQVLEVGVVAVGGSDVLQEDGSDDATSSPHQGNRGLVELPAVLLGSLSSREYFTERKVKETEQHTSCISMKPWAYEMILEA